MGSCSPNIEPREEEGREGGKNEDKLHRLDGCLVTSGVIYTPTLAQSAWRGVSDLSMDNGHGEQLAVIAEGRGDTRLFASPELPGRPLMCVLSRYRTSAMAWIAKLADGGYLISA
jgi:hypothetical protein